MTIGAHSSYDGIKAYMYLDGLVTIQRRFESSKTAAPHGGFKFFWKETTGHENTSSGPKVDWYGKGLNYFMIDPLGLLYI